MSKNETGSLPYTIYKDQIKKSDMNVRPETIKLLEENIGGKLLDNGLRNDLFGFDTKSNKGKNK